MGSQIRKQTLWLVVGNNEKREVEMGLILALITKKTRASFRHARGNNQPGLSSK